MEYPLISIIIPVYNGASYIVETIESVLSQTYPNFEVVCVDDGSTDHSYSIIQAYAEKDNRIRLFQKKNEGLASISLKYGLDKALGDYYMYSSQDDLLDETLFEKAALEISKSEPDVVIPNLVCYSGNKSDHSFRTFWNETVPHPERINNIEAFTLSLNWRIHGYGMYKISVARRVGIYTFNYNSDEYTTRKLLLECRKISFSDSIFFYRIDNRNAITKKMSIKLYDVFETNRLLEELAIEYGVTQTVILNMRELALNDVAIRQKYLYLYGTELTVQERLLAAKMTFDEYNRILSKSELYRNDFLRRLLFTHGFGLLRFSMYIRSIFTRICRQ